jgi:hypothetical protein
MYLSAAYAAKAANDIVPKPQPSANNERAPPRKTRCVKMMVPLLLCVIKVDQSGQIKRVVCRQVYGSLIIF